ncbi:MAG: hypothetical protein JW937_02790 [Candidatus Omnitrophica bacterium]|nr:hypothetical protein [Candidatus Omnitrophota bacterium]
MSPYRRLTTKRVGEILIAKGVVSKMQLDEALKLQLSRPGTRVGELLVEMGAATQLDVVQALTLQFGFPYFPVARYEISPDVLTLIPEESIRRLKAIPVERMGKVLTVAMSDPIDEAAIQEIAEATGCTLQITVSPFNEIEAAFENRRAALKEWNQDAQGGNS